MKHKNTHDAPLPRQNNGFIYKAICGYNNNRIIHVSLITWSSIVQYSETFASLNLVIWTVIFLI